MPGIGRIAWVLLGSTVPHGHSMWWIQTKLAVIVCCHPPVPKCISLLSLMSWLKESLRWCWCSWSVEWLMNLWLLPLVCSSPFRAPPLPTWTHVLFVSSTNGDAFPANPSTHFLTTPATPRNRGLYTPPHILRRVCTDCSDSAWTPHRLRAVWTDFFIPSYLCECAQSPHGVWVNLLGLQAVCTDNLSSNPLAQTRTEISPSLGWPYFIIVINNATYKDWTPSSTNTPRN